jgi:hypothetical protein
VFGKPWLTFAMPSGHFNAARLFAFAPRPIGGAEEQPAEPWEERALIKVQSERQCRGRQELTAGTKMFGIVTETGNSAHGPA